jgi:hypothetical protein
MRAVNNWCLKACSQEVTLITGIYLNISCFSFELTASPALLYQIELSVSWVSFNITFARKQGHQTF